MKVRKIAFGSSMALLIVFGLESWASAAFLRPGVTVRDGTSESPSLMTDPTGTTYLVWVDRREGQPKVYFNRSDDGGATWLPNDLPVVSGKVDWERVTTPQGTTDGKGRVYVAWQSVAPKQERKEIWVTSSPDGGRTWPREAATRLPDLGHAFLPQIVADAKGRVAVVWYEEFKKSAVHGLFISISDDGGKTWKAARRLDVAEPPGLLGGQRLLTDGAGRLYVIWWETRQKRNPVTMFSRSDDFGATWPEAPVRLNLVEGASGGPAIVADGKGHVYAVWDDARFGTSEIYFRMSADHGKSWGAEVRLDAHARGRDISLLPQIVAGPNGEIAVAWVDFRVAAPGIYIASSRDWGASWRPEQLLEPLPPQWVSTAVQLVGDGTGRLAIAWVASPGGPASRATGYRLSLSLSRDWGRTWQPAVELSSSTQTHPRPPLESPPVGQPVPSNPTPLGLGPILWGWHPAIAIDSRGTVLTIWEETLMNVRLTAIQGLSGSFYSDLILHRVPLQEP